jgi:hypothetical protein
MLEASGDFHADRETGGSSSTPRLSVGRKPKHGQRVVVAGFVVQGFSPKVASRARYMICSHSSSDLAKEHHLSQLK